MIKNILTALITVWVLSACQTNSTEGVAETKKPNVLLIIGDDHGNADLGGLSDDVQTPNFDRLAQQGVRFVNAYASSPICSPSRVGLMTGVYQQRQGVAWYGGPGINDERFPTIAEVLKKEGYNTAYMGKYHYGSHDNKTEHRSFPLNHGFDELFGFSGGRKHYLIHDEAKEEEFRRKMEKAESPKQSLKMEGFWRQDQKEDVEGFSTEILGGSAREYMTEKSKAENPFFLTLSFNAIHNFTHQLPPAYLEEKGLNGLKDWDPEIESYYDWYLEGRYPNNPEGRELYLGQLHFLDLEIGKILDFLSEKGLDENTIVVYVGDNGGSTPIYANNAPFAGSKYTMYEGGIRVPMFVAYPESFEGGKTRSDVVSAMDIMPTILDLVGAVQPEQMDGQSLLAVSEAKRTLYWDGGQQSAVRTGKWKYRWANADPESLAGRNAHYEGVELELGEYLYDLESDPGETTNLIESNPEIAGELKALLSDWKSSIKN